VRVDEYLTHLKVWAKEGITFKCFINCTLTEFSILQGTYFMLIESMPSKQPKEKLLFSILISVRMKTSNEASNVE